MTDTTLSTKGIFFKIQSCRKKFPSSIIYCSENHCLCNKSFINEMPIINNLTKLKLSRYKKDTKILPCTMSPYFNKYADRTWLSRNLLKTILSSNIIVRLFIVFWKCMQLKELKNYLKMTRIYRPTIYALIFYCFHLALECILT